ncbi:hypothetical protein GCM10010317_077660 [Streptomyces mirabilis]|uniref:hypothetical protein n=1 Tax=Streptomyces mirabilis TaxID=68239 RepID=UPI00167D4310|nr:hypothetical protein [Streptomyces mirabilis]GHD70405.1 hypothetical protein GCM10010317_077660 [Streptomyces mirabilis]
MNQPTTEDIAALRADGDLKSYLLALTGRTATPKSAPLAAAPAEPGYRLAHKGGWPIGTAATGPTPTHGRCTCPLCEQAAVVALPRPHDHAEGEAA